MNSIFTLVPCFALLLLSQVASATTPPDLVVLQDGSMMRGTISEYSTQDGATIVLASGEERRIPADSIQYAGPAENYRPARTEPEDSEPEEEPKLGEASVPAREADANAAPAAAPMEPTRPESEGQKTVRVRLRSTPQGLTFYRGGGAFAGFVAGAPGASQSGLGPGTMVAGTVTSVICTAPCETEMEPGGHTLALSKPNKGPREAEPFVLEGDATLEGRLESRAGARAALRVLGGAVAATGVALIVLSQTALEDCNEDTHFCKPNHGVLGGGVLMVPAGAALFMTAVFIKDKPVIRVLPYQQP